MAWYERFLGPLIDRRVQEAVSGKIASMEEATSFDFEFSEPYAKADTEVLGFKPFDREFREWSWTDRQEYLRRIHQVHERNPLAKGAVRMISSFVVGTGLQISYQAKEVEDIIERWKANPANRYARREKRFFTQLLVDGELILRIFDNGARGDLASVRVYPIKPWNLKWIETDPEDYTDVVAYHIFKEVFSGRDGDFVNRSVEEDVPAADVIYAALSDFDYEMRGRSELFAILPWLRAHKEFLENRARINRYKGFLYQLSLTGATPDQVSSKMSQFKKPPAPGSVYVSSDKEQLKEMGGNIDAGRAYEDGRQIKLMSAVGLSLPEYFLSDGYNANLASARAQQLPVLRVFEAFQDAYMEEVWAPVFKQIIERTLGILAEVDEVDEGGQPTGKRILATDAFTLTAQRVVEESPRDQAEAVTMDMANGILSAQDAAAIRGYDFRRQKRLMDLNQDEEALGIVQAQKTGGINSNDTDAQSSSEPGGDEGDDEEMP